MGNSPFSCKCSFIKKNLKRSQKSLCVFSWTNFLTSSMYAYFWSLEIWLPEEISIATFFYSCLTKKRSFWMPKTRSEKWGNEEIQHSISPIHLRDMAPTVWCRRCRSTRDCCPEKSVSEMRHGDVCDNWNECDNWNGDDWNGDNWTKARGIHCTANFF